jgi:solute:Na+ symporter, SSS family
MHTVPLIIISLYLVALFAVTVWARKLTSADSGFVGYLLAGRQLPSWVSAALLAGLAVGGASTIGVAQNAYNKGFGAGWYNAAWAVGALIMGLVAAAKYRKAEITTLPELFERHYTTSARIMGVIGQLVIQVVITSLQYVAGGSILHALMPELFSFNTGMVVTAVVFVGITLIGGFWAAGLTNVINVIVIYLGILLGAGLTVSELGGVSGFVAAMPEGYAGFDLWAIGPGTIAAWFVVMVTTTHSTQAVIQVGFACKDEKAATRAYLLGAALILPAGFISAIIGMAARIKFPAIKAVKAMPKVVLGLHPAASGIILSGLWAADVSTASALLMGSATLVCNDIVKRFFAPNISPARELLLSRVTVMALSVVTFLLALTVKGILKFLLSGLSLATAYTLILLMTLYAPGLCRRSSAFWTLLATMVAYVYWLIFPAHHFGLPHPIYFTWIVGLVTFFVVAAVDKNRIEAVA